MKKTLALFLALVTVLSIALVACNKNTPPASSGGDDEDVWADRTPNTSDTSTDTDNKKPTGGWEDFSGTIYAMANDLNIREKDSKGSGSLGKAKLGDALQAVAKSDDWYKITYEGKEAYVMADFVTEKQNDTLFDAESKVLKIKNTVVNEDGKDDFEKYAKVNLRTDPVLDDSTKKYTLIFSNTANNELMLVGTNKSGEWLKVEYTPTNGTKGTYYVHVDSLKWFEGYESGSVGGHG